MNKLGLGLYSILGVEARVYDAVHVEVEVIVFDVVRVLLARIHRNRNAVNHHRFLLDGVDNHHRVLLRQPPVKRRNSHFLSNFRRKSKTLRNSSQIPLSLNLSKGEKEKKKREKKK